MVTCAFSWIKHWIVNVLQGMWIKLKIDYNNFYPFSVHSIFITNLMQLFIKNYHHSRFKTSHVKNVCDAYFKN
jgi:hypothetical protein